MQAIVAIVFLSVYCKAYEEYKDIEYDRKDNDDFDDQYDTENMEDITTTTIVTTMNDETGEIHNRMRRFGEKSSGARTLSLEEIEDVKGALKELLAGRQLDGLTTGTETITSTDKTMIETTHDLTGLTKEVDSVDRTKFYEELIEEIINNAKKQGQGTNTARYTKPNVFETQTDNAEKTNDRKTTHTIDGEEETETTLKMYNEGNLGHNTNASTITFTTQMVPTKTPAMQSMARKGGKKVSTPPEASERKSFSSRNETIFPHWAQNLPFSLLPQAPKRTLSRTSARITIETVYDKKFGKYSKNAPSRFGNEKGEKYRELSLSANEDDYVEPDQSEQRWSELANDFPNMFPADHPFFPRSKAKKKLGRQRGKPKSIRTTTKPRATTNTQGEAGPGDSPEEDLDNPDLFLPPVKSTTTTTRRTTLILADAHLYPYPYPSEMFPNTSSTNATQTWRQRRRKTTTTSFTRPHVDVPALLTIVQKLTKDFESNITEMFNETLQTYYIPTCPPKGRGPVFYNLSTAPVVAKCFVCGLKEEAIPEESFCGDAFATDFLPLVPIDPQARQHLVRFRKYCRYLDVHNYYENETEPRSVYGRFTGGCSVRFMDLGNVYTQRACRNKRRAMTGKHFASKRMAKLEMALNEVDNGCIISPMASLVPMSRGISLYARFHACVCTGSWCNTAVLHPPWISYIAVPVYWTVMTFERWVGHWFRFTTM